MVAVLVVVIVAFLCNKYYKSWYQQQKLHRSPPPPPLPPPPPPPCRQDGFSITGSILAKSKFYGNSLSAILDGVCRLVMLNRGEEYTLTMPYAHCKGSCPGQFENYYFFKIMTKYNFYFSSLKKQCLPYACCFYRLWRFVRSRVLSYNVLYIIPIVSL